MPPAIGFSGNTLITRGKGPFASGDFAADLDYHIVVLA
jgi:hypothetical protein